MAVRPSLGAFLAAVTLAVAMFVGRPLQAEIGSDRPAAILVFPKILVDTSAPPVTERGRIDTLIRISNTSTNPISLKCFYINTNGHCRAARSTICDPYDLGADSPCADFDPCIAGWQETDFFLNVTPGQPIAWTASQGATRCDLSPDPDAPCFPLLDNLENKVPPVPENPFIGYLKCIAVDRNESPAPRNDLIGDAQFVRSDVDVLDIEGYNAIGILARPHSDLNTGAFDKTLVLGGSALCEDGTQAGQECESDEQCAGGGHCLLPEYDACPNILIMDHLFEGANDPISGEPVSTILTLVPCSDDFSQSEQVAGPLQFLVFNEFEQRFSASKMITCFHEFRLPDMQGGSVARSIFGAPVMGTLTGQTRLRGVIPGPGKRVGYTWLGMVEEFREDSGTAAFQLHFQGTRPESDFIRLP